MKTIQIKFVVIFVAVFFTACVHRPVYDVPPDTVRDSMPTIEQFVANHDFPYVASEERQNRVRKNYSRLSMGLSKAKVLEILGEPDYSRLSYSKGPLPLRYSGSKWMYYFEMSAANVVNLKLDKGVQVFFDTSEKTHWIVTDVAGLEEIGSPERQTSQQSNP